MNHQLEELTDFGLETQRLLFGCGCGHDASLAWGNCERAILGVARRFSSDIRLLEKVASGAFSDISFGSAAKGVTFAACAAGSGAG
jgi:hypothetical protein